MKTITINNETYVSEADYKKSLTKNKTEPTKKQIVILNRGWVAIGNYSEKGDECTLTDASIIRVWGTKNGLGELAEKGKLPETILDACPNLHFHKLTIVARMDVNESAWN